MASVVLKVSSPGECHDRRHRHQQRVVPINENRNYWQLTSIGLLRRPSLATGRRLVEQDVLAEADDVFFLFLDEALAAL